MVWFSLQKGDVRPSSSHWKQLSRFFISVPISAFDIVPLSPTAAMEEEVSQEILSPFLWHSLPPKTSKYLPVHPSLYEQRLVLHLSLHSYHIYTSAHNHRLNKLLRVKYGLKGAASWAQNHMCSTERDPHFPCAILVLALFVVIDTEHSKKLLLKSHQCCSSAVGQGVSHGGDISVKSSKT